MIRILNKRFTSKRKKYTQSQIARCEITIKVMDSRGKHEAEHKTVEIHTCIHALIIRKLMSVLHEDICVGKEFQRDAPAKEKLVLNTSLLGLGSIMQYHRSR